MLEGVVSVDTRDDLQVAYTFENEEANEIELRAEREEGGSSTEDGKEFAKGQGCGHG